VMVTGNPYRHPAVLANMAATVEVASGGRLELGIGAGWNQEESDAYGIDLPPLKERFDRLEEACEIIDSLLTKSVTTFQGRCYRITDARCEPKPVQQPRPPFVIGGGGEKRTLRIAARWADQWNLPGGSVDDYRHKLEVLHRHCADVGRDPSAIEPSIQVRFAGKPEEVAEQAAAYGEAGARHIIVTFRPPYDAAVLEPVAQALRPLASA
jgi:alkanesulfonate monooxygenase SsuD/methylene tetrahydromethanopterin reductase-like flavin-dependent oxidoreductase (luciferase family)